MKKKSSLFMLIIIALLLISGCASESELNPGKKEVFKKLPATMELNSSKIALKDISLYQSNANQEWYIYSTITIDITKLDEKEKHWLNKDAKEFLDSDKVLNPTIYLTCEENAIDSDDMIGYGYSDVGHYRVFFFGMMNSYKSNFDDSEITALIQLKQDDTYTSKNKSGEKFELNKVNEYTYNMDKQIKDVEEMPQDIYDAFNKRLKDLSDNM